MARKAEFSINGHEAYEAAVKSLIDTIIKTIN